MQGYWQYAAIHKPDNRERHVPWGTFKWAWHHVIPRSTRAVTTHLWDIQLPETMWHFHAQVTWRAMTDMWVQASPDLYSTLRDSLQEFQLFTLALSCLWVKARVMVNMSHIFACKLHCPDPLFPTQGFIKLLSRESMEIDWLLVFIRHWWPRCCGTQASSFVFISGL